MQQIVNQIQHYYIEQRSIRLKEHKKLKQMRMYCRRTFKLKCTQLLSVLQIINENPYIYNLIKNIFFDDPKVQNLKYGGLRTKINKSAIEN
ncbi:unnamed protein product [Paramecium octaurelia]|uniref:Uncharacterized protein n=1 Tax=Paramecium octaurelia TaxID=43137 RepID=A0A8S1WUE4_PAROT|nr:unnamed protein product [Paramecium octaurelia]